MKDDQLFLVHILECLNRVSEYTEPGRDHFLRDRKTQDAVLRNLHTLSESVQRISTKTKSRFPAVHWREIGAFRNVVVHDYLGIDLERIWDVIERDLPTLTEQIKSILSHFHS